MRKNPTDMHEIEKCRIGIRESADRWNELRMGGCTDPFWPDGTNMNLVRNHIVYYQRRITEICETKGIMLPEEATYDLPPVVSDNLYLRGDHGEVYERINSFHNVICPDKPPPQYEPVPTGQMCLW